MTVRHNGAASQFEVQHDDLLAVLQYDRTDKRLILVHTEAPEPLAGRGVGTALARAALAYAGAHRLFLHRRGAHGLPRPKGELHL